jgi:hypothetical protein
MIGGHFDRYNGTACYSFVRVNSDGSLDTSFNGGIDGTVYSIAVQAEVVEIEQPAGTSLVDGAASIGFGSILVGNASAPLVFTVRNVGTANLIGLAVSKNGANNSDFNVGALGATTLAPGASTTFSVALTPGGGKFACGSHSHCQ